MYNPRINFDFQYDSDFFERFRMLPNKAERVLQEIGMQIEHPTRKGGALSPKQQLCIILHWLGNGSQ